MLFAILEDWFSTQCIPIPAYNVTCLKLAFTSKQFNTRKAVIVLNDNHASVSRYKYDLPLGHDYSPTLCIPLTVVARRH